MPPKRTQLEDEKFSPVRPKRYNKRFKLRPHDTSTSAGNANEDQDIHNEPGEDEVDMASHSENNETNCTIVDFHEEPVKARLTESDCKVPVVDSVEEDTCSTLSKEQSQPSDFEHDIEYLLANITQHCTEEELEQEVEGAISDEESFVSDTEADDCHTEEKMSQDTDASIGDQPIYMGHSMTISVSMLLILLYTVTHGISGSQLSDLLTLIGMHCMEAHPGLKSIFHFKQHFAGLRSPLRKHYYCIHCMTCVNDEDICPNKFCGKSLKDAKNKSYFIEVPIETQLQNLFNRPVFFSLIQHRFSRKKNNEGNIEDIYDGEIYKTLSNNGGVLSANFPHNISFTLNTDGVPLFKSSKFSIWPVYLVINELPFRERKRTNNMIFCGLWFGDCKPFMGTFSRPMHQSLKTLEEKGISITVNEEIVTCKAFLICTTADLPAKSLLNNMNQFNGAHSCLRCCERGETFRTTSGGSVHIFPFNKERPFGQERTTEQCKKDAIEAANSNKPVNGIKGPSILMTLKYYDFVKGASIDYMHGVLLGVTKLLIKLWFSSGFSKEDFSISHSAEIIDKRLVNIRPPSFITRIPRSISTHFKYWKASELRSWLFFYSLPLLVDTLPESYLLHYASFVEAVFLLCGSSISAKAIRKSQNLLLYFVMTFNSLYGDRYQTLNVHQLIHLPECVKQLGPLWAYSCFYFETANGDLTRLFHGTQNVELQILSSVNVIQLLPSLISTAPEQYKSAIQKLFPGRLNKHVTSFHLQFLGKGYNKHLSDDAMQQFFKLIDYEMPNLTFHNRALLRGELYHSKDYTRVQKRNNFTVKYFCKKSKLVRYGYLQCFCTHTGMESVKSFALVFPTETVSTITTSVTIPNELGISVPHIHCVKPSSKTDIVEINNVMGVCVNVMVSTDNEDVTYICEPPNRMETD